MIVPCRDCAERGMGCHATCERYAEYARALAEAAADKRQRDLASDFIIEQTMERKRRWRKRKPKG